MSVNAGPGAHITKAPALEWPGCGQPQPKAASTVTGHMASEQLHNRPGFGVRETKVQILILQHSSFG